MTAMHCYSEVRRGACCHRIPEFQCAGNSAELGELTPPRGMTAMHCYSEVLGMCVLLLPKLGKLTPSYDEHHETPGGGGGGVCSM